MRPRASAASSISSQVPSLNIQCSTLGMDRLNSLISASNFCPSSATIW
jgi:hypothetical protein